MSQYVTLIRSTQTLDLIQDEYTGYVYALTTTSYPATGLATLQNYCPISLETIHTVHTRTRTDYLLRTLQIKFKQRLLHSFWYAFTSDDVDFIKSLNESNFSNMIGLIHHQLKKPDMSPSEGAAFIQEQLANTITLHTNLLHTLCRMNGRAILEWYDGEYTHLLYVKND